MPNSTPIANVEIQLQDGLQAGIPPVLFRTVPPVAYPSNIQVAYNGYAYVNPGASQVIIAPGLVPYFPFVYLRNAGSRGYLEATIVFSDSPTETSKMILSVGGVFLFANNSNLNTNSIFNGVSSLSIAPKNSDPIVAEWLVAQ